MTSHGGVLVPPTELTELMSEKPIEQLLYDLKTDPWRVQHPFSDEIEQFHDRLFDPDVTRSQKADVVKEWLASVHYPCLFGRKAAKAGSLSVLILEERDLLGSDQQITELIRDARDVWRSEALDGKKHALVILAVSERLAHAKPDETILAISRRLCEMYLSLPVQPDFVHRDELFLRVNTVPERRVRWEVGVDNFAAQADGRWWHDHRIPGGLAFSMNSVGHMVRTLVERALELNVDLRKRAAELTREKLIQFALPMAMRTILFAQENSNHPGTKLRPRAAGAAHSVDQRELERSAAMKGVLQWDETTYAGLYHTDHSLRSEFFQEDSKRRSAPWELDFTYLHARTELDYQAISIGEEILAILGAE
jgi:hypothetical protein